MDTEEKVVIICRAPGDYEGGEYPIDKIKNPRWGRVSGGVHKHCGGYSLYGYIPYEDAEKIVSCSGRHSYMGNDAKICIVAANNNKGKYKEAYKELAAKAGEKPKLNRTRTDTRPSGAPPCTKRALAIINEAKEISYSEVHHKLIDEGYKHSTIESAIKSLILKNKIKYTGMLPSYYHHPDKLFSIEQTNG